MDENHQLTQQANTATMKQQSSSSPSLHRPRQRSTRPHHAAAAGSHWVMYLVTAVMMLFGSNVLVQIQRDDSSGSIDSNSSNGNGSGNHNSRLVDGDTLTSRPPPIRTKMKKVEVTTGTDDQHHQQHQQQQQQQQNQNIHDSSNDNNNKIDNDKTLRYILKHIDAMTMPLKESAYYYYHPNPNNSASSQQPRSSSSKSRTRTVRNSKSSTIHSPTTIVLPNSVNIDENEKNEKKEDDNCVCDLLTLDCLDTIKCLPTTHNKDQQSIRLATTYVGIQLRRIIKQTAHYRYRFVDEGDNPIGKQLQYSTMTTWSVWRKGYDTKQHQKDNGNGNNVDDVIDVIITPLVLPIEYDYRYQSAFVGHKRYHICQQYKLRGKSCFFKGLWQGEDLAGTGGAGTATTSSIERQALQWARHNNCLLSSSAANSTISQPVKAKAKATSFVADEGSSCDDDVDHAIHHLISVVEQSAHSIANQSSSSIANAVAKKKDRHDDDDDDHDASMTQQNELLTLSPMGELLTFAHMMRILFNRRSFLQDIFESHLTTVYPNKKKQQELELEPESEHNHNNDDNNNDDDDDDDPFIVAVHIRRGDSCSIKNPLRYRKTASLIDSPPQTSSERKCYRTSVYLNAIQRIRSLLLVQQSSSSSSSDRTTRPLHVYLSTDDVGSVMEEIQNNHPDVFVAVDQWKFLNYSRSHFQYTTDFIEDYENENRPILGETAIADLWLLSHGDAFVGHLGSRFGKAGWLLATARRNNLIPYLSVDGHSYCCEIDEHCGEMSEYITDMENCMLFGHDYLEWDLGDEYWTEGSLARKKAQEMKWKNRKIEERN